ncbi:hypothetical protein N9J91_03770 [Gammaproteobacteria bacterium]|nr:hypothetical protein [Gammaproteobacteria bacterium]
MSINFLFSPTNIKSLDDAIILLESKGCWKAFDERAIAFVNELSSELLKDKSIKDYPDLVALAYWFRKSNIRKLHNSYDDNFYRKGRGLSLHIAPSNVDTIFVYSFFLSLLSGNTNFIRVSQNESPQLLILIDLFKKLEKTKKFEASSRFIICTYPHESSATKVVSEFCDLRLIWGGNNTTSLISSIPLKSTAMELKFADRSSYSAIDLSAIKRLNNEELSKLTNQFYSDIKMFGQQACSSPIAVYFIGEKALLDQANRFWDSLKNIPKKDETEAANIMNRLVSASSMIVSGAAKKIANFDHQDQIMLLDGALCSEKTFRDEHFGDGMIVQYFLSSLTELCNYIIHKDQTLSIFGFTDNDIISLVNSIKNRGIDRIVPIGKALDFNHIWDGYDLIDCMSRKIDIIK